MVKELIKTALAQSPPITSVADVQNTIAGIVNWMISGFWIAAVGAIIWAAFTFLTAGDEKEKVENPARNKSPTGPVPRKADTQSHRRRSGPVLALSSP